MPLKKVRDKLDQYDNIIQNMLTLRLSVIPTVADIKKENNMEIVHQDRESKMYSKMDKFASEHGISSELLKKLYKEIISEAVSIEYDFMKNGFNTPSINEDDMLELNSCMDRISDIFSMEFSENLTKLDKLAKKYNTTLYDLASIYHNNKLK